jgi:hypothetical protein
LISTNFLEKINNMHPSAESSSRLSWKSCHKYTAVFPFLNKRQQGLPLFTGSILSSLFVILVKPNKQAETSKEVEVRGTSFCRVSHSALG